jgi:Ca2+-binding EF-hand superfamily protein
MADSESGGGDVDGVGVSGGGGSVDAAAAEHNPPSTSSPASAAPPTAAEVVPIQLSAEEMEDARQVFNILAPGGALPMCDLELAIGSLGLFPSLEDLTAIRLELGAGAPALNCDAFVKVISRKFREDSGHEMKEAWSRLELPGAGEGTISIAEFRHMLMQTEKLTDDEADALVKRACAACGRHLPTPPTTLSCSHPLLPRHATARAEADMDAAGRITLDNFRSLVRSFQS